MAKKRTTPPQPTRTPGVTPDDRLARDRIEHEFDRSFVVEAGAGSGKTRSLARRMAAGIAAGVYEIEHMAAVTFTRKAAAELRGRFQEALEDRVRGCPDTAGRPAHVPAPDERARLEEALRQIERLFAGTIHAFCAHLLRERPVEARIAPGFVELDEIEDARRRQQAWRDFFARERATASSRLDEFQRAGLRPADLDAAFAIVCQNEDVEFPAGDAEVPDVERGWRSLEAFWKALEPLVPSDPDPEAKCKALPLALEFGGRFRYARRWKRQPATLADLLGEWKRVKVTMTWWGHTGRQAKELHERFKADVADPFVDAWRRYVYRVAVGVLIAARGFYASERRCQNVVNYVDLLLVTANLLRSDPDVRHALQQKYRWFFIDEFQDTDPIQAEIFLLLTRSRWPAAGGLTPGSLFVVGDPKQSIYRFRRADIDIYNRVCDLIVSSGGEVLHLTANWRSLPGVCALANTVFPDLFPPEATRESPAFEPLDPRREESGSPGGPRVARLIVPATVSKKDVAVWEADAVARYVQAEVTRGARRYGSFLVLTRYRGRLVHYADAFDRFQIPVEVSGAGRFGGSEQVAAVASLLASLADPLDGAALVGVLRGPLFGISDQELFAFRSAGGRFELVAPLLGDDADRLVEAERDPERASSLVEYLDRRYGPAMSALSRLRMWRALARRLPLGAAVERMLEDTGWLAIAAASPGGAKAGDLLQAVDVVRQVAEGGGGLAEAADALTEGEDVSAELEALPLEPGRRDVVRLMNLHKAKGLEADVVFLADPPHGRGFDVDVRIDRNATAGFTRPLGYLEIARRREGQFWRTVLGQPAGWDDHRVIEERYRDAEVHRLLYVAATRARDLLVVGQWAHVDSKGKTQNEAWGAFDDFLAGVPELAVPETGTGSVSSAPVAERTSVRVSIARRDIEAARAAAGAARAARHASARVASWHVASVTGEHVPIRTRASRIRDAMADPDVVAGAATRVSPVADRRSPIAESDPLATDASTDRVDAGAAWGTLIHGLLEHAMRHRDAPRNDLERLARWLTVEHEDLRPAIPTALDTVEAVMGSEIWREAQASGDLHVEVPFAVLLEMWAGPEKGSGSVLRGVIDLVYRAADGWRIVDYKTDRVEGGIAELLERHGLQLGSYVNAWHVVTGEAPARAGIFGVRDVRIAWSAATPAAGS